MNTSMNTSMNARGFSLIEALIALSILSVVLASVVPLFITFSRSNLDSQHRTEAIAVAQMVVDELRQQSFEQWPESWPDPDGVKSLSSGHEDTLYDARISYCTADLPLCGSGARHTRVEVVKDGKTYYQVETVYTQFDVPQD